MKAYLLGTGTRLCFHALSFSIVCVHAGFLLSSSVRRSIERGGGWAGEQCAALRRRSDPQIRNGRTRLIKRERTSIELMYVNVRCSFRPVSRTHAALSIPIDHWNFQTGHPISRFDRLLAHAYSLALVNRSYSISQFIQTRTPLSMCFISSFFSFAFDKISYY